MWSLRAALVVVLLGAWLYAKGWALGFVLLGAAVLAWWCVAVLIDRLSLPVGAAHVDSAPVAENGSGRPAGPVGPQAPTMSPRLGALVAALWRRALLLALWALIVALAVSAVRGLVWSAGWPWG